MKTSVLERRKGRMLETTFSFSSGDDEEWGSLFWFVVELPSCIDMQHSVMGYS